MSFFLCYVTIRTALLFDDLHSKIGSIKFIRVEILYFKIFLVTFIVGAKSILYSMRYSMAFIITHLVTQILEVFYSAMPKAIHIIIVIISFISMPNDNSECYILAEFFITNRH